MSRRVKIRLISYACALVICFVGVLSASAAGAKRYEARINADTARALSCAVESVNALDISLKKSACALTPAMQNSICTEICSYAKQAEIALSVLPVRSDSLEEIAKHIAVVGDYAAMLSRAHASGHDFLPEELQTLARFSETTSELNGALKELQQMIASGAVPNEVFTRITDSLDNLEKDAGQNIDTMETRMAALAEAFPSVPALVYDGVYTDRSDIRPKLLEGATEISEDEASMIASEWIGCRPDALTSCGVVDGDIAVYCFSGKQENEKFRIAVTRQGGFVCWMNLDAAASDGSLSMDEAISRGSAYLSARGLEQLRPIACTVSGGEASVCFAAVQDDILCYSDCVELTVSLSSGKVVSYRAEDYIQNHTDRDGGVFSDNPEQLNLPIPTFLSIQSVNKTILPAIGTEERSCYCVDCVDENGLPYLIYINASTGEQEEILLPEELEIML